MPKPEFSAEDLEQAYQQATQGASKPSLMWITCPDCGSMFILPREADSICQCLAKRMELEDKRRAKT